MPGQKKDTPDELDGGRIFYETLKTQIPESEMATEWLLKFGLLPIEEATKIMEERERNKEKEKNKADASKRNSGGSKKKASTVHRKKTSKSKKSKKRAKVETKEAKKKVFSIPSGDSGESSSDENVFDTKSSKRLKVEA